MADPSYLAWCREHQVHMHGVKPAYVAEGWRGVVATQELAPGHVVMTVPQDMLMSVLSAQQDPVLALLLPRQHLSSHQVLTIHLLHEASKGPASQWHSYIRQLPRTYTTCLCWETGAVQDLQLPYAQAAAAEAVCRARQEWTSAREVLQQLGADKKWCSWRAWQWAYTTVLSRTMYHPADPACGCLTPLGDLHNCAPPPPPHTPQLQQDLQQLLEQQQQLLEQQQQQQQQQCPAPAPQPQEAAQEQQQQPQLSQPGVLPPHRQQDAMNGGQPRLPGAVAARTESKQEAISSSCGLQGAATAAAAAAAAASAAVEDCSSSASASTQDVQPSEALSLLVTSTAAACPSGPAVVMDADKAAASVCSSSSSSSAASGASSAEADATICGDGQFDAVEGCYKIFARTRYQPGQQVFLCYGRHTNLALLELYGFILPDNPHDTALLPPDLVQQHLQAVAARQQQQQQQQQQQRQGVQEGRRTHSRHLQKQQQARVCVVDVSEVDCMVHANGQPSWELLRALRCAAAGVAGCTEHAYRAHCGQPVSLASELLVLQTLSGACREQLGVLPTSMAEDVQLMMQAAAAAPAADEATAAEGGACHDLAVRWRTGYKAALTSCAERCEALVAACLRCMV